MKRSEEATPPSEGSTHNRASMVAMLANLKQLMQDIKSSKVRGGGREGGREGGLGCTLNPCPYMYSKSLPLYVCYSMYYLTTYIPVFRSSLTRGTGVRSY